MTPPSSQLLTLVLATKSVNVHGNFDAGMAQLALNILEVKDIGAFHAAGHIVAQHMEGGGNAQPFPGLFFRPDKGRAGYAPCRR